MTNFLFTLGNGDAEAATRCFQLANVGRSKGHIVNLIFFEDGVLWANSTRDFTVRTRTGDCPNDYLPYLVEKEVPIGV